MERGKSSVIGTVFGINRQIRFDFASYVIGRKTYLICGKNSAETVIFEEKACKFFEGNVFFGVYFICGIIIGIFFDLFRILRQSFKTSDIVTYIEDIIFGILTGIFLIFIIFIFDNGELRAFTFIALVLGAILYLLTISRYFIRINVNILTFLKKVIVKTFIIISYPFKIIKKYFFKLILRPYKIFTINLKNILKNKIIKRKKIKKIYKDRKDFSE